MKRKIGTILEENLLVTAKQRAALEGRAFSDLIQDALNDYLQQDPAHGDALRACEKFCSHGSLLGREEIEEILQEDMLIL